MNAIRLLLVTMLVLLSGCGFHLRGNIDLPANLKQMHVQGVSQFSDLGRELHRGLVSNGVNVVDSVARAEVILKVAAPDYNRRLLSVSGLSGKVSEYELQYSLTISLHDRKGEVLLAPQQLRQLRDYTFDRNSVIGKNTEEERLRKEMERDLVRQVLLRISAYRNG